MNTNKIREVNIQKGFICILLMFLASSIASLVSYLMDDKFEGLFYGVLSFVFLMGMFFYVYQRVRK